MNRCACTGYCAHVVTTAGPDASPSTRQNVADANRLRASMRAAAGESGFDAATNQPAAPLAESAYQDVYVRKYDNGVTIIIPTHLVAVEHDDVR